MLTSFNHSLPFALAVDQKPTETTRFHDWKLPGIGADERRAVGFDGVGQYIPANTAGDMMAIEYSFAAQFPADR